ncbi:HepT-like ribonuclease domain-containing protein [Mucilaginibacter sp. UYCu711]|uniref:HepT-like ribonuclease domain-containing protein n=1 Tax=Mucilaginibacter sp. UYCu711 TaxID=3156339 RepID=UPI003D22B82D
MKPSERDPILYLEDIVLSMQRVQEYIAPFDFHGFKRDYKTVDAVIRNFEIIGEASKNLPTPIKDANTHIPWEEMYRLRNRISHEYFGIDYEIIWNIVTEHLLKI